jgi:hypothetical protein
MVGYCYLALVALFSALVSCRYGKELPFFLLAKVENLVNITWVENLFCLFVLACDVVLFSKFRIVVSWTVWLSFEFLNEVLFSYFM